MSEIFNPNVIREESVGVTQMPISPRENPILGFYESPVVTDFLAKVESIDTILPFNTTGIKKGQEQKPVDSTVDYIKRLGIENPFIYIDGKSENLARVSEFLKHGFGKGFIYETRGGIFYSDDGLTEFLDHEDNLTPAINNRSEYTYYVVNGVPYSKLTNLALKHEIRDCLMLRLPEQQLDIEVFPQYAHAEFDALYKQFRGRSILISRLSEKPIKVETGNIRSYNIDPDMYWMPFLHILQEYFFMYAKDLVVVNNTLKQAVLSTMLTQLVEATPPERVIVLPKIDLDFGERSTLRAEEFLRKYGPFVTNMLLLQGIGTQRKEIVLDSSLVHWIKKSFENVDIGTNNPPEISVAEVLEHKGNPAVLPAQLKKIRQGRFDDLDAVFKYIAYYSKLHV